MPLLPTDPNNPGQPIPQANYTPAQQVEFDLEAGRELYESTIPRVVENSYLRTAQPPALNIKGGA
jgi:hypothetical protein